MNDSVYVQDDLARDERRIRLQRQGAMIVFGGMALGLACWTAAANGVLVAVAGDALLAAVLIVAGVLLGLASVVVILAGIRRRRRAYAPGDEPGSALGKADPAFDHDARLNPTGPPYLNWTAAGGMMGGN
ncbi:MAG TPA: hypothetical protein VN133_06105 [Humibacter sp.]|nr:hypothetical protein [Humibacter sp.]